MRGNRKNQGMVDYIWNKKETISLAEKIKMNHWEELWKRRRLKEAAPMLGYVGLHCPL